MSPGWGHLDIFDCFSTDNALWLCPETKAEELSDPEPKVLHYCGCRRTPFSDRSASQPSPLTIVSLLVLLASDIGAAETAGLFIDWLTATFAASAIVVTLNAVFSRLTLWRVKAVPENSLSTS